MAFESGRTRERTEPKSASITEVVLAGDFSPVALGVAQVLADLPRGIYPVVNFHVAELRSGKRLLFAVTETVLEFDADGLPVWHRLFRDCPVRPAAEEAARRYLAGAGLAAWDEVPVNPCGWLPPGASYAVRTYVLRDEQLLDVTGALGLAFQQEGEALVVNAAECLRDGLPRFYMFVVARRLHIEAGVPDPAVMGRDVLPLRVHKRLLKQELRGHWQGRVWENTRPVAKTLLK